MTTYPGDAAAAEIDGPRHVDVSRDGRPVASAHVETTTDPSGTAKVTFHSPHGDPVPDARRELVDAVLDQPSVRSSDHLHAVVPLGDAPVISRLDQRTDNLSARAAGASSIVDAELRPADDA